MADEMKPDTTSGEATPQDVEPQSRADHSLVSGVAELARLASGVSRVPGIDDLIAVPDGMKVMAEDAVRSPGLESAPRIDRTEVVTTPAAFVAFVRRYGNTETVVFTDRQSGRAQAILNYVSSRQAESAKPARATRCDWIVNYQAAASMPFSVLRALEHETVGTEEFALQLLSLRSAFREVPYSVEEESALADISDIEFLLQSTGARGATPANFLDLLMRKPVLADLPLAMIFRMPIVEGGPERDVHVLMQAKGKAGVQMQVIDPERKLLSAMNEAIAMISSALGSAYGAYDATLAGDAQ